MMLIRYLPTLIPILILLALQFRQTTPFNKHRITRQLRSTNRKLSSVPTHQNNHNSEYILNVGKALDVLIRELPLVFAVQNLDFSILSSQITVINENQRSLVLSKEVYVTAIRGIQMASTISSTYPSIRVRKIEYIEDIRTIQCLVGILPSSNQLVSTVTHNIGQDTPLWEGMFYFGLNKEGLIETHIFDRKISNLKPEEKTKCCEFGELCNG